MSTFLPFCYRSYSSEEERATRIDSIGALTEKYILEQKCFIPSKGEIAGPEAQISSEKYVNPMHPIYDPAFGEDNIHFSMGTYFLEVGIGEIVKKANYTAENAATLSQKAYARGVERTYKAISAYILRHANEAEKHGTAFLDLAKRCRKVAIDPPETLLEAIQLYWFIWVLRSAISPLHALDKGYYTAPLGRLDLVFYPYYLADIRSGRENEDSIRRILVDFINKLNCIGTGDTLKNLMLGGQDAQGKDTVNELTMLFLDSAIEARRAEPHFNVRFHPNAPKAFKEKSMELMLQGQGQATLYNDNAILQGLQEYGIPREFAVQYANDGCEEVIIDRIGSIAFHEMEILKCLELAMFNGQENPYETSFVKARWTEALPKRALKTKMEIGFKSGDVTTAQSFDDFYAMFLRQFFHQVDIALSEIQRECAYIENDSIGSMVLAGGYRESVEKGLNPLSHGVKVKCYQLHSGSLPPVADALAAIRQVVYVEKAVTMEELIAALSCNYEGYETLRQKMLSAPKFGNDIDQVDLIAADLSKRFCQYVKDTPMPEGCAVWPGIYSIVFMDDAYITKASADGRKVGDPLSVHYSPVPGRAFEGPTAVLLSAAKTDLYEGVAASPVFLTVSRSLIPENNEGLALVRSLVDSSIELGLPILSLGINDIGELKDAQIHPERHGDLVVRVWGFNAKFVDLTHEMQEHVIRRTLHV